MIPRRKIDELIVRHQYEPTLRDIYVEGLFDKEVLTSFISYSGTDHIVYDIDGIDIGPDILAKHGLTDGNKQRVIALAKELSVVTEDSQYRCVADKDLDHWIEKIEQIPRLNWTEHTSIELYFYTKKILTDIVVVSGRAKITDIDEFINSLAFVLKTLYAFRVADRELGWNMEWIEPFKDLSTQGSSLRINTNSYLNRLLSKNRRHRDQAEFSELLEVWLARLTGDPRSYIRGHDFVSLIAWSTREFKGIKEVCDSVIIERMLVLISRSVEDLANLIR